ncbi:[acyl-carrier-protein] S-malonyltransferase [Rhodothalassium salexigens]|uniref:ACP S-malonyltransferase n=1 Tax=Rhodothalassium salexigens TaxID=1086 RepID=UPI00191377E5|nr:ACP S-malonyltransferase [Rhodothalassium salexigens]MBK5911585.1 [acyl-carrier-protein] S-malonyltransferase [Rhodothalassium salexigens]
MTRALVFPGQGAQTVGMGRALADAYKPAAHVFEEVDEALSQNLSQLMFDGPADELTLTENAQPALMAVSMAMIRTLEDGGKTVADIASHVAGHSLGEYTALAAAGALDLGETARLLKRRGQAMQRAVPVGEGAMAAILGLDLDAVRDVAARAAADGGVCAPANDNAPGQVVVSGDAAAVERAVARAKEAGAKKAMTLAVSAPFHCPLMQPAAEEMAEALAGARIAAPAVPVVANVTAEPVTEPETIRRLLVEQVTAPVRWRESVAAFASLGIDGVVEVGPGKVLTGMVKRIDRSLALTNVSDPESFDAWLATL